MSALRAILAAAVGVALGTAAAADPLHDARGRDGWVSWVVPLAVREAPCCFTWRRGEPQQKVCRLDRRSSDSVGTFHVDGTLGKASPPGVELQLYLRFDRGAPRQILAVGSDCPVDAGAQTVTTIEGVAPAASASFLLELADAARGDLADETLNALSLHGGVGTDLLLSVARDPQRSVKARKQALFWLAQSDDPRALEELDRILSR